MTEVSPDASPPASPRSLAASRSRNLIVFFAAVASVALAARLGFWQLDRASQKLALQSRMEARGAEPALPASALARRAEGVEAQVARRVELSGRWLVERTVFLDNRQMEDKVGFYVVTPLLLDGTNDAVLVQRGWAPRNSSERTALPTMATPQGRVRVEGTIEATPPRLLELSPGASGPIRQNVDPLPYARETGLPLLPLAIVERATPANAGDGLDRAWPAPAANVQMHYGYAFQWFAIAGVIVFLYVWFRIVRPCQRRRA